jgi:hypothetical protein
MILRLFVFEMTLRIKIVNFAKLSNADATFFVQGGDFICRKQRLEMY